MYIKKDYTQYVNTKYGKLLILKIFTGNNGSKQCSCKCDCGNITKATNLKRLLDGKITACKSCANRLNGAKGIISARNNSEYNYLIGTTVNYFKILRRAVKETDPINETGLFVCQCVCGNIRYLDSYDILHNGRKSCGCQQGKLLSLSAGGTGIPHEISTVNDLIRKTEHYEQWRTACFKAANYTCSISGVHGGSLNVHHIIPLKTIRDTYNITKENYTEFYDVIFDINNGIVLSEELHKRFHTLYGRNTTKEQLDKFIISCQSIQEN